MKKRKEKPTAIGLLCGIGSLAIGAKQAGFRVIGNVDPRRLFHKRDADGRNTFEEYFRAPIVSSLDEIDIPHRVDIACGMPACGGYSNMLASTYKPGDPRHTAKRLDPREIPTFVAMLKEIQPRFFFMDNLPGSLAAFTADDWMESFPEYDVFFEWVSNYGYGNAQKGRNRLFVIGARREERFSFRPGEYAYEMTVEDVIGDIVEKWDTLPNHHRHVESTVAQKSIHMFERGEKVTWRRLKSWFRKAKSGEMITYITESGERKMRPAIMFKTHWDGPAHVLLGAPGVQIHPATLLPMSLRERARLMGFPDDFVFYDEKVRPDGTWDSDKNGDVITQTGRCIPIEFCRFLSRQIRAHIDKKPFACSGERLIKRNTIVDHAKMKFCRERGYADQRAACSNCWIEECPIGKAGRPIKADRARIITMEDL